MNRRPGLSLCLFCLLAVSLIRLWLMPLGSSFWVDETATAFVVHYGARHPSFAAAPQVPASIYYVLPAAAERLLGFSEAAYRLPSLLLMAVALWVVTRLAARLIHPRAAWFAAFACLALNGFNDQAADARPYALGTATATLGVWFLVRWLDTARWRDAWAFAAMGALLWRVHLLFAPFYLVFAAYALARLGRGKSPVPWRQAAVIFSAVVLALLPVAFGAAGLIGHATAHVIVAPPTLRDLANSLKYGLLLVSGAGAWLAVRIARRFGVPAWSLTAPTTAGPGGLLAAGSAEPGGPSATREPTHAARSSAGTGSAEPAGRSETREPAERGWLAAGSAEPVGLSGVARPTETEDRSKRDPAEPGVWPATASADPAQVWPPDPLAASPADPMAPPPVHAPGLSPARPPANWDRPLTVRPEPHDSILILSWWLFPPVCLFAISLIAGSSVFVSRYYSLSLAGAALAATLWASRSLAAGAWKPAAALLGVGALVAAGHWTRLWPAHQRSDWRDAAREVRQLAADPATPVICPSPFVEARPPVWSANYRLPGFLYSHLAVYPLAGRILLFPFNDSPEAESYAAQIAGTTLGPARRFVIYGGAGQAGFWWKWLAARPQLAGWGSRRIGEFGDVTVVLFSKANSETRTTREAPLESPGGQ